jgi:hypothetical protein
MTIVGLGGYRGVGSTSRQIASAASCQVACATAHRGEPSGSACNPRWASHVCSIGHDLRPMTRGLDSED